VKNKSMVVFQKKKIKTICFSCATIMHLDSNKHRATSAAVLTGFFGGNNTGDG